MRGWRMRGWGGASGKYKHHIVYMHILHKHAFPLILHMHSLLCSVPVGVLSQVKDQQGLVVCQVSGTTRAASHQICPCEVCSSMAGARMAKRGLYLPITCRRWSQPRFPR